MMECEHADTLPKSEEQRRTQQQLSARELTRTNDWPRGSMSRPLPAHETKNVALLSYPLPTGETVQVRQDDAGVDSTGWTVWLGAQVLSAYLHSLLGVQKPTQRRKRVIELGAGTGLLSLALAHLGFDVLATDVALVQPLLARNLHVNKPSSGSLLQANILDWTIDPESWDFCQPLGISRDGVTTSKESTTTTTTTTSLCPPFDLIVTSDSVYSPDLIHPLLRTMHALSLPPHTPSSRTPPTIYLALEVRDPQLIDTFLDEARSDRYSFKCIKIDHGKIEKLVGVGGWGWTKDDWEGVEVWRLRLAIIGGGGGRGRKSMRALQPGSTKG